ncbi:MAG: hypothetical protein IKV41_04035 [Oscillospiraceae bacterium]|nr:hypothetical protein [Oscillospiraceae bacterium]
MSVIKLILLAMLVLLVALMIVPTVLFVQGSGEKWLVRLRLFCFWLNIYPTEEKKKKAPQKQKTKKPAPKQAEQPQPQKKQDIKQLLPLIMDAVHNAGKPLRMILKGFTLYQVRLDMRICDEDPDQAAISYGRMNGYVYGAMATVKNMIKVKDTKICLVSDFTPDAESSFNVSAKLKVRPAVLLAAAAVFAFGFVRSILKRQKTQKTQEAAANDNDKAAGACSA